VPETRAVGQMLRLVPVRREGQNERLGRASVAISEAAALEADHVGRPGLGSFLVEIAVVVVAQQLEGQAEMVVQGHAAHRPGQRGLLGDHLLHAGQAVPCLTWRNHVTHFVSAPVLQTG